MSKVRSFVIVLGLSCGFAGPAALYAQDAVKCDSSAGPGFSCNTACPLPPTGSSISYLDRNCNCKKDRTAGTCTPSGECDAYIGGQTTGQRVNCVCNKVQHSGTGGSGNSDGTAPAVLN